MSSALQIAVVGAGHWGPNLIRNFDDQTRSQVRWVVDPVEERLNAVASRFPKTRVSRDLSDALGDSEVDAFVIATPTATHASLASAALRAGKHVMVEKPLTNAVSSARMVCELAEARGLALLVGHVFVYNPAVQWIKQRLDAGDLGQLYHLSSTRTNLGPIRVDVNCSWDLAAQDIAIFNYLLGSRPIGVSAMGKGWINPGIQDAVFATFRYPDDVLVNLHASWLNPCKVRNITVVASKKMLTYDDMNLSEPIRLYDKRVVSSNSAAAYVDTFAGFRSVVHTGDITIPPVSMGEPLRAECMHFLDCIEQGQRPLTGGREALAVVETLEAVDRSMANGGREELL